MSKLVELKIGDKVKVVRKIDYHQDKSFKNSWGSDMTDNIGKIGIVETLNTNGTGYCIRIKGSLSYSYSRKSLRKLK